MIAGDDRLTRQARLVVDTFEQDERARIEQAELGDLDPSHRFGSTEASTSRRKLIQKRLGHASMRTTSLIYGSVLDSDDVAVAEALDQLFFEDPGGDSYEG